MRSAGALVEHLAVDHDLILRFLDFDHLAEFGRLTGLAFPNDFRVRLKHAKELVLGSRVASQHAFPRLLHHLLYSRNHFVELLFGFLQNNPRAFFDLAGDLAGEPFGLPDHSTGRLQQLAVSDLHLLLAFLAFVAAGVSDLQNTPFYAPRAIPKLRSHFANHRRHFLHYANEHPHAVAHERAVGRIVDIGFHYGCVDSHLAARYDFLFQSDRHGALMQLLDCFRTQLTCHPAHGLVVGNLPAADASELPINKVGTHFARHIFVTPAAHVLQQQHPQNDFGWRPRASTRLAPFVESCPLLHNNLEQLIVIQCLVGVAHPGLPEILDFFDDEAIGEAALQTAGGDHALPSFDSSRSSRNKYWFSSLIASSVSFAWR